MEVLKRSAYFRNQEDEFFSELEPKLIRVEVDHGTDIIGQGSYVQWLIIVEIGRLTKYRKGENGHNFVNLGNVEAGEITGIHHLIHVNHPEECIAYATITSKGPSVVWKLGRDDFQSVLTSKPQFSLSFMCTLSKEMRQGSKILRSLAKLHDGRLRGENGEPSSSTQNIFRVLCYDSSRWVRDNLIPAVKAFNDKYSKEKDVWLHIEFSADTLGEHSVANASGYDAVCLFVNDIANEDIIATLSIMGVRLICMRCTGVDRLDRGAAAAHNLTVCRVPAYSPYAVAEHAIALFMEINRKIHRAITNIAQQVFTLDGLLGMDVHGKTVAVLGTGKIGRCLCNILLGFGVNLICYDLLEDVSLKAKGGKYLPLDEIWSQSDVIFFMLPLYENTLHLFNKEVIGKLKNGAMIINTSRGGLIDTDALIEGLQTDVVKAAALDVYENEAEYFFRDMSSGTMKDSTLARLIGMANVIITPHQAFYTQEAINGIVDKTMENIVMYMDGKVLRDHPNSIF